MAMRYNRKCFIFKEDLERMYIYENLSRRQIAKILGVHKDTVYYWLKKYKIKLKPRGRPRG